MDVTVLLFSGICGACFAGALFMAMHRNSALKELMGEKKPGFVPQIRDFAVYLKARVVRANTLIAKGRRYERAAFNITKLGLNEKLSAGSLLFIEQSAAVVSFALLFALSEDFLLAAAMGIAAFFIPSAVLKAKAAEKDAEIMRELPDALDMIAASIEAGLSLNRSIVRYAEKNRNALSDELAEASKKMQFGKSFEEAMTGIDGKLDIPEVSGFINAFVQADKIGGNVREIIREQAEEARKKRFQFLKKKAYEAPVKLLIPLLIFIFPVIFIVLFGPIVIKLLQGM